MNLVDWFFRAAFDISAFMHERLVNLDHIPHVTEVFLLLDPALVAWRGSGEK